MVDKTLPTLGAGTTVSGTDLVIMRQGADTDDTKILVSALTTFAASEAKTLTNKVINGANNTLTVRLANDVTGTLPVANGGTGITSDVSPQNSQSADYTLVIGDASKHIYHPAADTTPRTWTIPANGSVAFPVGTIIGLVNEGSAGAITLAITTDTLCWGSSTGSRTIAANGTASLLKVTSTKWRLTGDGIT